MERREDPRFPADLRGLVTRLSAPEERLPMRLEDVSEGGIRLHTAEALACGSFVVIEIEDSTLFGQVKYSGPGESGYTAGILVERMLIGGSDLSRLIENLLAPAY